MGQGLSFMYIALAFTSSFLHWSHSIHPLNLVEEQLVQISRLLVIFSHLSKSSGYLAHIKYAQGFLLFKNFFYFKFLF